MPRQKKTETAPGKPLAEVFREEAAAEPEAQAVETITETVPEPEAEPEVAAEGDGYGPLPEWAGELVEVVRDFGSFRIVKDSEGRTIKQYREE